jgi:hypothetical protein
MAETNGQVLNALQRVKAFLIAWALGKGPYGSSKSLNPAYLREAVDGYIACLEYDVQFKLTGLPKWVPGARQWVLFNQQTDVIRRIPIPIRHILVDAVIDGRLTLAQIRTYALRGTLPELGSPEDAAEAPQLTACTT